jgi:hypothetical protein
MTNDDVNLKIFELLASGARLGLFCNACGRFRYLTTDRLSDNQIVKAIADKLSCIRCWSDDVSTRAVLRDARTGYWPAESG